MPVINAENRDAWQKIADEASKNRPFAGRKVRIERGKHKGKVGSVQRHERDPYQPDAWRYGGEGCLALREMQGRYGFRVLVRPPVGDAFWTKAEYAAVLSDGEYAGALHALDDDVEYK